MDEQDDLHLSDPEEPSEELARLAREAIESQSATADMVKARQRCQRVITLYEQGEVKDARDHFHAAWVLLYGETLAHYSMSRMFARLSTEMGEARAWTIRAMAWDRWLVRSGFPQRFGTQLIKQDGRWSLGEVDPQVTDFDRALYAVPPLYVQQQSAEQLQRRDER